MASVPATNPGGDAAGDAGPCGRMGLARSHPALFPLGTVRPAWFILASVCGRRGSSKPLSPVCSLAITWVRIGPSVVIPGRKRLEFRTVRPVVDVRLPGGEGRVGPGDTPPDHDAVEDGRRDPGGRSFENVAESRA